MTSPRNPRGYSEDFFAKEAEPSSTSAAEVVPYLVDLLDPRSIVDVGCGCGHWLAAFKEQGVEDVLGIDGAHVPVDCLRVAPAEFRAADLTGDFDVGRTFDLAVSLEVAEHLPESAAKHFVSSLARLSRLVIFSAAVPFQGGRDHVNEQWQDYWRALFELEGFVPTDVLRTRFWRNERIEPYYTQNMVLYVRGDAFDHLGAEITARRVAPEVSLNVVHPRLFERKADPTIEGLAMQLARARLALAAALRRRYRR